MKTLKMAKKLTLKVRRPDGKIEHVVHPTLKSVSDAQFKQIQEGTKKAGRGEVLSFEVEYENVTTYSPHELAQDRTTENAMTLNGKSM